MELAILVVHVIAALSIVTLVLLQHGKGADMGAAFGSGSAGSMFGSSGSANFLSRITAVMAVIFFVSSISLTIFSGKTSGNKGLMKDPVESSQSSLPTQIPTPPPSVPASSVPVPSAPASAGGGDKAGEVPK